MANYCRSPVAEILLKNKYKDKYEFFSAGISPISMANMDPRSLEFLKENNVDHVIHTPKKINSRMLNYFDKILAVDLYVLNKLNLAYPKYRNKFTLLSLQFNDLSIIDPYKFTKDEYVKIMNNIKHISEKINLEEV